LVGAGTILQRLTADEARQLADVRVFGPKRHEE
jgi:2-keto-3-deoxy-6-phosphogluconate aldolase